MLALLTSTILVRVETQEEAGKMAAEMTGKIEEELNAGFEARGIDPEDGRQHAAHLGVLVQIVPESVAS
jgi:hypothetical protein